MAVRTYSGNARPIDDKFEGREGFESVEADAPDGSIERGYRETATGTLYSMTTMVVSSARQAAMTAARDAAAAADAQIVTFKQSIVALAAVVAANSGTAIQQAAAQRALLVKLSRAVLGLMSD